MAKLSKYYKHVNGAVLEVKKHRVDQWNGSNTYRFKANNGHVYLYEDCNPSTKKEYNEYKAKNPY